MVPFWFGWIDRRRGLEQPDTSAAKITNGDTGIAGMSSPSAALFSSSDGSARRYSVVPVHNGKSRIAIEPIESFLDGHTLIRML